MVAPSLLSADFLRLGEEIEMLNTSMADWFHLDVMDGVFVPNISFGFPLIEKISKASQKPLDVHLMIIEPERYISRFREKGASCISVHIETCHHLHRTVAMIHESGCKAGVALNPHTPIGLLDEILEEVDFILLMSVNPGFGGQKFITATLRKVEKLKNILVEKNLPVLIEVDGGIGLQNYKDLIAAGADILVAGNAIFHSPNPQEVIAKLKTG